MSNLLFLVLTLVPSATFLIQAKTVIYSAQINGTNQNGSSGNDLDHGTVIFADEHSVESQAVSNFYLAISILITVVLSGLIEVGQALFK